MQWSTPYELYDKLRPLLSSRQPATADLQVIRYELALTRTNCLKALYEAQAKNLYPKETTVTDLDRKTILNGLTAEIQSDYEFLVRLEKIIDDAIQLAIKMPADVGQVLTEEKDSVGSAVKLAE